MLKLIIVGSLFGLIGFAAGRITAPVPSRGGAGGAGGTEQPPLVQMADDVLSLCRNITPLAEEIRSNPIFAQVRRLTI